MSDAQTQLPLMRVPAWADIAGLAHGFAGRRGGVSCGDFAGLNLSLSVGDDAHCVGENWRRLRQAVGGGLRYVSMKQHHGAEVAYVDGRTAATPDGDALMTRSAGLALCVLTADCVPILLVAPRQRVIAAVHAGWRGTLLGIVERAVREIERRFGVSPAALHAALGPAIGGCCYEVERRITDELETRWGLMPGAIATHAAKSHLDLRQANAAILAAAGVAPAHITSLGPCTRCATAEYFSHRAAGAAANTGRQLSFIGWRNRVVSQFDFSAVCAEGSFDFKRRWF